MRHLQITRHLWKTNRIRFIVELDGIRDIIGELNRFSELCRVVVLAIVCGAAGLDQLAVRWHLYVALASIEPKSVHYDAFNVGESHLCSGPTTDKTLTKRKPARSFFG